MPKRNVNKDSRVRRYREEWEKQVDFRGWLSRAPACLGKTDYAYCKYCKTALRPHKSDLTAHQNTENHLVRSESMISRAQKHITDFGVEHISDEKKNIDIKLVLNSVIHGSIRSIDHLGEMLKECGKGSKLATLRLHRTKSSKLILNVIAPAFAEEMIDDIGDQYYSIIVDESTDVSTFKYMAYCVRYFSVKHQKIITDFLGFSEVTGTTALELYATFKEFMNSIGLKLEKIIGIGTDGASNLCGKNHSLYTLLRNDVPSLQLVKCTCHSIDTSVSNASKELPSHILYLLRETSNWFANSALRQSMYEDVFAKCNSGRKPPKFLSLSMTRWLVVYSANSIVMKQWDELKLFSNNVVESKKIKCYTAKSLAQMLNDGANYLYLIFLDGILKDVYDLNLVFQRQNADITKLYSELRILIVSLARRIFKPVYLSSLESPQDSSSMLHHADLDAVQRALGKTNDEFGNSLLPLNSMDFGHKFDKSAEERMISANDLQIVKERAAALIIKLCKEFIQRLPPNPSVLENMRYFAPSVCLSQTHIPVTNLPWDLARNDADEGAIDSQWRRLQTMKLNEISPDFQAPVNVTDFWTAVWNIRNANGDRTFEDLSLFALRALSLPISNADVERVFSVMAAIKTKIRNRMLMPMLVALIRIRIHLKIHNLCCKSYTPTKNMLDRFNKNMYKEDPKKLMVQDDDLLEVFQLFDQSSRDAEMDW